MRSGFAAVRRQAKSNVSQNAVDARLTAPLAATVLRSPPKPGRPSMKSVFCGADMHRNRR